MNELEKKLEEYQETVKEVTEAREDALTEMTHFTLDSLGALKEKLLEGVDNLSETIAKKDYYDTGLGATIKELIQSVLTEFAKQKAPNIEFKPQIKVDLQPIQSVISNLSSQNDAIIDVANKLLSLNGDDKLHKLIVLLIEQQKAFIDKGLKEVDYREDLKSIIAALNKKSDRVKRLEAIHGEGGRIKFVEIEYENKTNNK